MRCGPSGLYRNVSRMPYTIHECDLRYTVIERWPVLQLAADGLSAQVSLDDHGISQQVVSFAFQHNLA